MPNQHRESDAEWRKRLTSEQFHVTREKGTERAFAGKYHDCNVEGLYRCVCCGATLFSSDAKYDSGTGWPSFHSPAQEENLTLEDDSSLGMRRTEVRCSQCGAHLGHLFADGPKPTRRRYCINSAALDLERRTGGQAGRRAGGR